MRKELRTLTCVLALGGAMLVGCGDDGGVEPGVDSGTTPVDSGGETPDSGPAPTLPVATLAEGAAPDWTCIGEETAPTPGAPITSTVTFGGPIAPNMPDGTMIDFFPGNVVTEGCTPPACISAATTDDVATVMLPADGWFAYRAPDTSASFPTVGYFRPATAAASGTVIADVVVTLIPGIFMRMRLPGTSVMSGAAYDCMGRPVGGVEARVFVDGTRVVQGTTPTSPFVGYLKEGTDDAETPYTFPDAAQFAIANIPPGLTRLELWAVQAEGEEPTRVGCEEVQTFADTVIVATPGGLRSDYAEGSGCAE